MIIDHTVMSAWLNAHCFGLEESVMGLKSRPVHSTLLYNVDSANINKGNKVRFYHYYVK